MLSGNGDIETVFLQCASVRDLFGIHFFHVISNKNANLISKWKFFTDWRSFRIFPDLYHLFFVLKSHIGHCQKPPPFGIHLNFDSGGGRGSWPAHAPTEPVIFKTPPGSVKRDFFPLWSFFKWYRRPCLWANAFYRFKFKQEKILDAIFWSTLHLIWAIFLL